MKLVRIEAWAVDLTLHEPYTIAYETIDRATNVFLRIMTDGDMVGIGAAGPDLEITGETAETVLRAVREIVEPLLFGENLLSLNYLTSLLESALEGQPAARAIVETALFDLQSKRSFLPLYQYLGGGFRRRIMTAMMIGIKPVECTVEYAEHLVRRGFRMLKVKGGRNPEEDLEKLAKVREAVGKDVRILFDANQGFTRGEASTFLRSLEPLRVECVEQPCDANDLDAFCALKSDVRVPLMADEALVTPADALALAAHGGVDVYNIKLMKVGGLSVAMQINAIAHAHRINVVMGCMDEAALSVLPALHLALAQPNVPFVDLDSQYDYVDDPSAQAIIFEDGYLSVPDGPGLGFSLE